MYFIRANIPLSVNQPTQIEKSKIDKYRKKLAPKLLDTPLPLTKIDKKSLITRKLLKKSFFKKTTLLTFQPLVFPYYTPHILPSIKTLRFDKLHSTVLLRYLEKTHKKHSILLSKCKHLNTLITPSEFALCYLKSIRKLRELKHLEIGILDSQIPQIFDMFKHLIQLKSLKLVISKGPLGHIKPHTILKFLKNLTNLKNLSKLKLQIGDSFVSENEKILMELLENLGNSNIKEMDIEIHLKDSLSRVKNPSEGIQKFLGKLDSLGAYQAQGMNINSNLGKKPGPYLKSLTFVYIGSGHQEIDLKDYLGFCTSLKDLWIHCSTQSVFISENTTISKELKVFRIRSFVPSKQARIETTINSLVGLKLQVFDIQLADLDYILVKKIAEVNQALDPQGMKNFSLRTEFLVGGKNKEIGVQKMLSSNSINQLVQSLVPFKNLESLELHIGPQDQKFIKHIEYLFDFLPQLKRMDLDFRSVDPELNNFKEKIPFYFAIEKMPGLDFIRVKLPPAIWIENPEGFFEKIAGLKNIKHLELDSYHLMHIPQESIPKIISTFDKMKTFDTLKIVHIPNFELQREFTFIIDNKSRS